MASMRGCWRQENGFKHGVERWGINQLDRRETIAYDRAQPGAAPTGSRDARRTACIREGDARRMLGQLPDEDRRRARIERDLEDAIALQRQLEEQRPTTPKHAPLRDTELAGKLRRHESGSKTVLDTLRIACANAEADLAALLASRLPRATEAKKTLANLLAAPGRVRVGLRTDSGTRDLPADFGSSQPVPRRRRALGGIG